MKVYCEYLENPVGIDLKHPRFSWEGESGGNGRGQKSYHIYVAKKKKDLKEKANLVWDSGEVLSAQNVNVPYAGDRLETAETYYYQVEAMDEPDGIRHSGEGSFTTGIMEEQPWRASWLGGPWMEEGAFWFRTSISIQKKVEAAFIYVVSPNYYVLTVNGKKCSDAVLQNANTDSAKTVLYATYPVKDLLKQGENAIGIELGNGWKALSMSVAQAGLGEHLFSLQMLLKFDDGSSQWILSESDDWFYTNKGPVKENCIYHGETYDARCELPGWNEIGYDMGSAGVPWYQAVEFEPEPGEVKAQYLEPIKVVAYREPEKIYQLPDGSYTFDMGQNFSGWSRLKIKGPKGLSIKMLHAELMHDDHTVNQLSLRGVRATDTYILKGEGVEIYEPRFTYHGYRYVQVFGLLHKPDADTITGCVVRSDVAQIGTFVCNEPLLNQLQSNINWTEQSNLHSIPTDCPQRDERLGWINDMTVRNECALYNFRLAQLYTKWLRDIRDTQGEKTGAITDTAPFRVFGCRPADPVGAVTFLLPWNMYRHYGDKRIIEECYDANKKLAAYLKRNSTEYIIRWATMGDWASPVGETDKNSIGGGAVSTVTPLRLMATAYFYYDCCLMANMARVLGREEDAAYYLYEAGKIKQAFIREFYNPQEKCFGKNSQGSNTIALYLGLVPEADRDAVLKNLIADIQSNDMHLTTGNMCSRYIIEVLLQNGYRDIAYELLTQTTYPSWGYMIENGATTLWERWEKVTEECPMSKMASHNHPMYGAVGVCFYKYFAGIDADEKEPGFKNVIVRPVIPTKLQKVEAGVQTLHGKIGNTWEKKKDGSFFMRTEIPFNCTATVRIPLGELELQDPVITVNGRKIYEHHKYIEGADYLSLKETEKDAITFLTGSGIYEFECRP